MQSCPTSPSAKRDRSENNAFTLYPSWKLLRFSRLFSKYIPLKIRSTNESRLFSGSLHSGAKLKINRSNCAFKIINLPILSFVSFFLFPFHFCISLFYYFFTLDFTGTQVRTVRTGSYALLLDSPRISNATTNSEEG